MEHAQATPCGCVRDSTVLRQCAPCSLRCKGNVFQGRRHEGSSQIGDGCQAQPLLLAASHPAILPAILCRSLLLAPSHAATPVELALMVAADTEERHVNSIRSKYLFQYEITK